MDTDNEIKYLGIDWGDARIGLAIASSISKTAVPLRVVGQLSEVMDAISQEEIDEIVIGKPIKMSGQDYNLTPAYETFIHSLHEIIKIPIHFIDERLTSVMADNLSTDKKQSAPQDAIAAMLILQTYLDQSY
jgi:putative Holliday junction resolvase